VWYVETRQRISESHTGKTHTDKTRAQMSNSQQLVDRTGANNSWFGKSGELSPVAKRVFVYSIDNQLV